MSAVLARLNSRTVSTDTGCLIWQGATTEGYGRINLNGSLRLAHRVAYEAAVGPIPEGMSLDHLCRVRACINPAHLEPVTSRTNTLRGVGVTAVNARKTHCDRGHEFTEANTRLRGGRRYCRACVTVRNAARSAAWPSGRSSSP